MITKKFDIIGMTCASCANAIDQVLKRKEGVIKANINLGNDTAFITFDESKINIDQVIQTIESAGYEKKKH
jgi:Cu+-exporting ATPase